MNLEKLYNSTGYIWMAISFFAILVSSALFLYLESRVPYFHLRLNNWYPTAVDMQSAVDLLTISIVYMKGFLIVSLIMSLFTFGIQRFNKTILILSEYVSYLNIIMITAFSILLINSLLPILSPMKYEMANFDIFIWLMRIMIIFFGLSLISVFYIYLKFVYKIKNESASKNSILN